MDPRISDEEKRNIESVKDDWRRLMFIPYTQRTAAVCLAAVQQNGDALQSVPLDLKTEALCLLAVSKTGAAIQFVPEDKKTEAVYLAAVQRDGLALAFIPEGLRTEKLCLAAVKQYGGALIYVPQALRTSELCLEAVKQSGCALGNVPVDKITKDIYLAAVQQDKKAIYYVPVAERGEILSLVPDLDKLYEMPGFPEGLPKMVLHPASGPLFERGKEGQGYVWIAWKNPDAKEESLTIALVPAYNKDNKDIGFDKHGKSLPYYVRSPEPRGGNTGVIHKLAIDELAYQKIMSRDIKREYLFGGGLFKDKSSGSEPLCLFLEFMAKSGTMNMTSVRYCRELVLALKYGYFDERSDPKIPPPSDYFDFYIQRELPKEITHAVCDFLLKSLPCPPEVKREVGVISEQHYAAAWWTKNLFNFPERNARLMQSFFIAIREKQNDTAEEMLAYIKKNFIKMYPGDKERQKRELRELLNTTFGAEQNTALLKAVKEDNQRGIAILLREGASFGVRNAAKDTILKIANKTMQEMIPVLMETHNWDLLAAILAEKDLREPLRLSRDQDRVMHEKAMDLAEAFIRYAEGISNLDEKRETVSTVLNEKNELGKLLATHPGPSLFGPAGSSTPLSPALHRIADAFKNLHIIRQQPVKMASPKEEEQIFRQDPSGKGKPIKFDPRL